jgi:hypothetical protein
VTTAEQIHVSVIDCPSYAWNESDQAARYELGSEFYGHYQVLLDDEAHELIRAHLRARWRQLGYRAVLVEYHTFVNTPPSLDLAEVPDEQRSAVWQHAAGRITAAQLVHEAFLVDEWAAYRREHPES